MSIHDHYVALLAQAQHREAIRQCDPQAIREDLKKAGITNPNATYRFDPAKGFQLQHRWLVTSFSPRMHAKVQKGCKERGWAFNCPMGTVWQQVKHPKKGEPKKVAVEKPLFGTYGFLRPEEIGKGDLRSLERVDGLGGLVRLSISHEPVTVPMGEVERFGMAQADGEFDETRIRPPKVKKGDEVRILNGPFESFRGIVDMTIGERVKLLMGWLGPVDLPMDAVELVA